MPISATPQPVPLALAAPGRSYPWVKIGVILLLSLVLYAQVLQDLANDWWTWDNLSYGMLIPPLALYIAWIRRDITLATPASSDNRGLYLIGSACFLYIVGKIGAEFFLPRISFVVLLAGLVWTFWGRARLKTLAFPLVLLATMVPLPVIVYNAAAAPLQLLASQIATSVAQACGISIYRDGNVIMLAHVSLGVEEACSGLNSLAALIVGSVLLGFLKCRRPITRFVLFALSVPLAIAVNVVRVVGTAIIADYHEKFAMGFYHSFTGWLIFVVGFGAQYLVTVLLVRLFESRRKAECASGPR